MSQVLEEGGQLREPLYNPMYRVSGELTRTESVMQRGIMFGNSGALSLERATQMADILCEFLER